MGTSKCILTPHSGPLPFEERGRNGVRQTRFGSIVFLDPQEAQIMPAESRGAVEVSLAERRPAAAFATRNERDFESCRFEHSHRCTANVRLVVPNERVVPKEDF